MQHGRASRRILVVIAGAALLAPAGVVGGAAASSASCNVAKAKLAKDKKRHAPASVIARDKKRVKAACG